MGQNNEKRPSKPVKDAINGKKWMKKIIQYRGVILAVIDILFVLFLICYMIYLVPQLVIIGKTSNLIRKASEELLAVGIQIIVTINWSKKKNTSWTMEMIFRTITQGVLINCLILLSLVLSSMADLVEYKENTSASQDISVPEYKGKNIVETEQIIVITVAPYKFDDDPYVMPENIDAYRGVLKGTTQMEGNEIEAAANIVYADMLTVYSMRTAVSDDKFINYKNKTKTANAFHEEYKKWYENQPDGSSSDVAQFMRMERIRILEQVIDCGIQADDAYGDVENRRMMAIYYIEMGDEYQAGGDMEKAEYCFDQSSIWGMKALYLAIPGTNITKMKQCLKRLEIASERMAGINGSKSYELSRAFDIYERAVDLRAADL